MNRMKPKPSWRYRDLYYITHVDNIPSILEKGILSHALIEEEKITYKPIYNSIIVNTRKNKFAPNGKNLWSFANLYFQPRNPMLYRVLCDNQKEDIAVLGVLRNPILKSRKIFITDGNAASSATNIFTFDKKTLALILENTEKDFWTEESGDKRKIMAECLVPDLIPPDYIQTIYVANREVADKVEHLFGNIDIPVVPQPNIFFEASIVNDFSNLFLVKGDMFFSRLQTLTISVNCIGVMGKGLASRTKYQFPDVYVEYQKTCRNKKLQMGKPYLYKREKSLDYQLADDPGTLTNGNGETWFLLFATKYHWREMSDAGSIEKGLQWLQDNYQKEGIKSLAIPALGCGLGRLKWEDMGPILCKYLASLDIKVWLYLPAEKQIPEKYLTKEFLL